VCPRNALPRPLLYIPPVLVRKNPDSFCSPHRASSITRSRSTLTSAHRRVLLGCQEPLLVAGTVCPHRLPAVSSLRPLRLYLDTDERRKMGTPPRVPHRAAAVHGRRVRRLLLQQDQARSTTPLQGEIIWVVQPDANADYCSSLTPPVSSSAPSAPSPSTTPTP
jgi:hypothetical protein